MKTGEWAIVCERCGLNRQWTGLPTADPGCPKCTRDAKIEIARNNVRIEQAEALVADIEEAMEQIEEDGSEKAVEFGRSVCERASSILVTIQEKREVTDKQMTAIENMRNGIFRWVR